MAADPNVATRLATLGDTLGAVTLLDLEPARPLLVAGYSHRKGGKPPRNPVAMLRALALMLMCGLTSINHWVRRLKGEPELLVLSGFDPAAGAPGVGTFYDFIARILDGAYDSHLKPGSRPSDRVRARSFLRQLGEEKTARKAVTQAELALANQGRVEQLVKAGIAARGQPTPNDFSYRLNEILTLCAVVPSAAMGLLGDLRSLVMAGDGTSIRSHAADFGHATCTCKKDGLPKCSCYRRYSDPTATCGWDSHREEYYFGYRLHALVSHFEAKDLPLQVSAEGAHTPDVVMGVEATLRLTKRFSLPDLRTHVSKAVWDAGYDAMGFYRLHAALGIAPLIPLATVAKTPACVDQIPRNDEGTPLCKGLLPMRLHQRNVPDQELVYNCPVKRPGRENGKPVFKNHVEECPLGVLCDSKSVMGPIVHLKLAGDPRMNLAIPRESAQFTELYKERTTTERFNSTLKSKGHMANGAFRRQHVAHMAGMLHAVGMHAKAWVKKLFGMATKVDVSAVLARLRKEVEPKLAVG